MATCGNGCHVHKGLIYGEATLCDTPYSTCSKKRMRNCKENLKPNAVTWSGSWVRRKAPEWLHAGHYIQIFRVHGKRWEGRSRAGEGAVSVAPSITHGEALPLWMWSQDGGLQQRYPTTAWGVLRSPGAPVSAMQATLEVQHHGTISKSIRPRFAASDGFPALTWYLGHCPCLPRGYVRVRVTVCTASPATRSTCSGHKPKYLGRRLGLNRTRNEATLPPRAGHPNGNRVDDWAGELPIEESHSIDVKCAD